MENNRKQEIEDLAWKIFLNKLGISFKRELTAEEKSKITGDDEFYKHYRDIAEKFVEKRERAIKNKKYPVIDVPASGKPEWSGGAYTLCFVYSKYKGNFVLRGYMREVENYLKKNYTHYFCNFSLWHCVQNRDIWKFWKDRYFISHPSIKEKKKGKKIVIRPYYTNSDLSEEELKEKTFMFKRLPKRWIPLFDNL